MKTTARVAVNTNTIELAANLLFWQRLEAETRGRDAEAHKDALAGVRVARAEFASAALGDMMADAKRVLAARDLTQSQA